MARPCTICGHERREEIDAAFRNKVPYETIGARFQLALTSILTHRNHLDGLGAPGAGPTPPGQTPTTQQAGVEVLLDHMRALCEKSFALLQAAEASSEARKISLALVQVRRNLRAFGDLTEQVRQATRGTNRPASRGMSDGVAPAETL